MAVCSHCGTSLDCPDHGTHKVEGVAEECPLNRMGVVWVEVVDDMGRHVDGVTVDACGSTRNTSGGFVQSEPLAAGSTYTAKISGPLPSTHKSTHALPLKLDQTDIAVQNGQIKQVIFRLRAIVNPVISIEKKVVAFKGEKRPVVLKADRAFSGKGTLTCVSGADKVKFFRGETELALAGGKVEFEGLSEAGLSLDLEAIDFSPLDGIELKWELTSETDPVGAAVSEKMTAVKATLDIYNKSGAALSIDVKQGDGRVVILQNAEKAHKRAKLTVKCEPTDFVGTLVLTPITTSVALYDAEDASTDSAAEKTLPLEIAVGAGAPAALHVQGKTVSGAKSDSGFKLSIKGVADDVDLAKVTVVDARLDVYLERTAPSTEPVIMTPAAKKDPGRLLVKQDAKFKRSRGKLVLVKLPKDAPCKIKLKAAGAKVKLFLEANEKHIDAEVAVTLPKEVTATEIGDDKGLVYWAEGAGLTTLKEATFEFDVEEVEDACDKAFFSVVDLCAENGTDPAPRLLPVKNKITDATPVEDYKVKIKLVHTLGTCGVAWSYADSKFTLSGQTTETVQLVAGPDPSDDAEKEELKVVITPDGKPAFPALIHRVGVVEILFEQVATHAGGYDKYEVINYELQNGSTTSFDPPEKYDFISIKKSTDGKVTAKYKGAFKEDIFFVPVDAAIAKPKKDSPDAASPYPLEIEAKAKDKHETVLEARLESKTGKIVNKLGLVVLKQKDMEAEFFRVHDSTNPATNLGHALTGPQITNYLKKSYEAGIATLTVANGGLKDINYDTTPRNGKLDLEPGMTSAEETLIIAGCISAKSRIVYVKELQWSYYLRADAAVGDTVLKIKNYGAHYLGFIGVGNEYEFFSNATSITATVTAVDTATGDVTIDTALVDELTLADSACLVWPLGGLSGDPAWLQEDSEVKLIECVGHELGHQLASFVDICEIANLMFATAGNTSARLRHREISRYYPGSGGEKQWLTIPR